MQWFDASRKRLGSPTSEHLLVRASFEICELLKESSPDIFSGRLECAVSLGAGQMKSEAGQQHPL